MINMCGPGLSVFDKILFTIIVPLILFLINFSLFHFLKKLKKTRLIILIISIIIFVFWMYVSVLGWLDTGTFC